MKNKPKNKGNLKSKKQQIDTPKDLYVVFTDGACDNIREPHYGGSAFIIIQPETGEILHKYSKGLKNVTNNKAELFAIVEAMKALPDNCSCGIFTDSKYCIYVLDHTTCSFPKNMEYIEEFRKVVEDKNISYQFQWVKAHTGKNKWNDIVDKMANEAFVQMGGNLIDYNKFQKDAKYRAEEFTKAKYLNACLEIAKDFIPLGHFESFEKELNLKFNEL